MKQIRLITVAAIFAALAALTVNAQQQPAARPTSPAPAGGANASGAEGKIAIINTDAFGDDKSGITRLVNAMKSVDSEFQPRKTELQNLRNRYDALAADIQKTQGVADRTELQKKADQAESLKTDIERKGQDAQNAYQKRMGEVVGPLYDDIGKSLEAFARQRGIAIIIDASKLQGAIFQISDGADITAAFVADYNRTHPATASIAAPGK